MPLQEIEDILVKYKKEEEKVDTLLKQRTERITSKDNNNLLNDCKEKMSIEDVKKRNYQLLKDLEAVKGRLRSKAIFCPTEIQWQKICRNYQNHPSLPVITWRCNLPVFV